MKSSDARWLGLLLALGVATAGCSIFKRSEPARFYLLTADTPDRDEQSGPEGPTIGLMLAHLPEYMDRPAVIFRGEGSEVQATEFQRWAESCEEGVTRVVRTNLMTMIPTSQVLLHPWYPGVALDYRMVVDVGQLDCNLTGDVVLLVQWWLMNAEGDRVLERATRTYRASAPVAGDVDACVRTMSTTLAELSREVAAAIAGQWSLNTR